MPMNELGHVGVVDHVDGHRFAFRYANQRARRGSVITNCADVPARGKFHQDRRDFQREICGRLRHAGVLILSWVLHPGHLRRLLRRQQSAKPQTSRERASHLDKIASVHFSSLPRARKQGACTRSSTPARDVGCWHSRSECLSQGPLPQEIDLAHPATLFDAEYSFNVSEPHFAIGADKRGQILYQHSAHYHPDNFVPCCH